MIIRVNKVCEVATTRAGERDGQRSSGGNAGDGGGDGEMTLQRWRRMNRMNFKIDKVISLSF